MSTSRVAAAIVATGFLMLGGLFVVTQTSFVDAAVQILGSQIKSGTITANQLATNSVTSKQIKDGAIEGKDIKNATISASKITNGTITTGKLANGAITSAKIADGTIVAADIADGTITGAKISGGLNTDIADGSVTNAMLAGSITADKLAGSITGSLLTDATITATQLGTGAVTSAKILDGTIVSGDITDATIVAADIADGTITNAKLAGSITSANLVDGSKIHTQNTDTGTTSSSFQVNNDASGPKLTASSGRLQVGDSTGDVDAGELQTDYTRSRGLLLGAGTLDDSAYNASLPPSNYIVFANGSFSHAFGPLVGVPATIQAIMSSSSSSGGLQTNGVGTGDDAATISYTAVTDTVHSAKPYYVFDTLRLDGSGVPTATGATEKVFEIKVSDSAVVDVLGSGNVGLGDSTPTDAKLKVVGSVCVVASGDCSAAVAGTIYAGNTSVQAADLAELYVPTDTSLEAGDLVALDPDHEVQVTKATAAKKDLLYSVVSTKPGLTLGLGVTKNGIPIALAGRIPTKVVGDIAVGDYITISDTAGVGRKALAGEPTVGRALQKHTGSATGKIEVLVSRDVRGGASVAGSNTTVNNNSQTPSWMIAVFSIVGGILGGALVSYVGKRRS